MPACNAASLAVRLEKFGIIRPRSTTTPEAPNGEPEVLMPHRRAILSAILCIVAACPDSSATGSGETTSDTLTRGSSEVTTSVPTSGHDGSATGDETTGGSTEPGAVCGNGVVELGEGCDDGADNGAGQACDATCQPHAVVCGNGVVDPGEACDDGPDNADTNSCTADCTNNLCGDGKVGPGEGCDDGNAIDDDACTNACALSTCGDGELAPGEQCDDGDRDDTNTCTTACTAAICSDGFVQPGIGEQCDAGADNADDAACTNACQDAVCGDGLVWSSDGGAESCDNGANNGAGKACNAQCQSNVCGDGDPSPDQPCDDGNKESGDGCSADCQLEGCGNGSADVGEQCDDGQDGDNDDGCTDACKTPVCGDGFVQPSIGEGCDLGGANTDAGDCTLACMLAACGDGLVHAQDEQCDDGPDNGPGQACRADCSTNVCGDGDQGPGEECDDGNPIDGDGCSSTCVDQSGDGIVTFSSGYASNCVLLMGGKLKCWGFNSLGGLGLGDKNARGDMPGEMGAALPYVDLGADKVVIAVEVGDARTCAILQGGSLKCWGSNYSGRLGLGDTHHRGDGPGEMGDALPAVDLGPGALVKQVACGSNSTCALLVNGTIRCWGGQNIHGDLGAGKSFLQDDIGDESDEMGAATPTANLGGTVKLISAGAVHYCGQLENDSIKCWGANESGQLGLGNTTDRGNKPNDMGNNLPTVNLGLPGGEVVTGLTTGSYHSCVLTSMGRVKCWGANDYAQLGLGDTQNRGDSPGEVNGAPMIDLGAGKKAIAIAASQRSTCATLDTGELKCWGYSFLIGYGDLNNRGDAPGEMGDSLPAVNLGAGLKPVQLDTNAWSDPFRCAVLNNGRMKCWGTNAYGQLGVIGGNLGDTLAEMGDNLPFVDLL